MKTKFKFFATTILFMILILNSKLFSKNTNILLTGDGIIKGTVVDTNSKQNIEYATIALYKKNDTTLITGITSNSSGNFILNKIPNGEYILIITYMGFKKHEISDLKVDDNKNLIDLGLIKLTPNSTTLNETEILTERKMIEYKIDKKVINSNNQIASLGGTAVDLLRNTPSVTVDAEDNVQIRGNSNYQVLINGRPTSLAGNETLKQIPASSIENIELITNPSANHDAEGTSGIINIIMKKNVNQGLGGFFTITGGNDRLVEDININYKKNRWNIFFGAKFMDYNVLVNSKMNRNFFGTDSSNFLTDRATQYHITQSRNINFGIDYDMDKNNLFSFNINLGTWMHVHNFDSKYQINYQEINNNYSLSSNDFKIGNKYLSSNLNYKRIFEGKNHDIQANIFFSYIDGYRDFNAGHYFSNSEWINQGCYKTVKSYESNLSNDFRIKIDYRKTIFEKYLLETGYQTQLTPYNADMKYYTSDLNNPQWTESKDYTNDIFFNTQLHALYCSITGNINKFEYKAGLRGEYYDRLFKYSEDKDKFMYQNFDLFPSFHLSYNLNPANQFQLSYSKRIQRPNSWFMYPVPNFSDDFMIALGNPNLKPEYIDSYQINYIHQFKKIMLSSELFHRVQNNSFVQKFDIDSNGRLNMQSVNFGIQKSTGLELSANASLNKWLNLNISGSFYHFLLNVNFLNNENVVSYASNLRFNSSILFSKTSKMQLTFSYDSPFEYTQGLMSESINYSLSFRKEFFDKKISISATSINPFRGRVMKYEVNGPQFTSTSREVISQSYFISISFKLNNFKKQRNAGEQNNIGEGIS